MKKIFCLALVGLAVLAWPLASLAVEGGGISVFPADHKAYPGTRSWFVYEVEPGTTITDKVQVINNNSRTMNIRVAVLDGAVTNDGGYTLVGNNDENKDIGTWSSLSKTLLVMPPYTKQFIDLEVKVPENADVGSHPGGVVIWEDQAMKPDSQKKSAGQLSVMTRVAARLYLTVPGDIIRKLDITNVRHTIENGVLYFRMTLHNAGNVQLLPAADITLKGIFGKIGEQPGSHLGMLLRGSTIESRVPWQKKAPKIGRFVANFRIHYGEKDFKGEYVKDEYQDIRYVFWLLPSWLTIAWWVGIIFLLFLMRKFWLWVIVRQRMNTKTAKHTIRKGETLTIIANIHAVDAKKIAKFNLLKWPYDLQVGDVLLIPAGQMTKEEKAYQKAHPELQTRHLDLLSASKQGILMGQLQNLFRRRSNIPIRHSGEPPGRLQNRTDQSDSVRQLAESQDDGLSGRNDNTPPILPLVRGGVGGVGIEPVIIEVGDTVKTVAEFAGVTPQEIIALNKLNWPYKLRAGQELFIPVAGTSESEVSDKVKRKPNVTKKSAGASRLSAKKTVKRRPKKVN